MWLKLLSKAFEQTCTTDQATHEQLSILHNKLPCSSSDNIGGTPCICSRQVWINWYPCSLKYCRNHEGDGEHRCGIKTCQKCLTFRYRAKSKLHCSWDEPWNFLIIIVISPLFSVHEYLIFHEIDKLWTWLKFILNKYLTKVLDNSSNSFKKQCLWCVKSCQTR